MFVLLHRIGGGSEEDRKDRASLHGSKQEYEEDNLGLLSDEEKEKRA